MSYTPHTGGHSGVVFERFVDVSFAINVARRIAEPEVKRARSARPQQAIMLALVGAVMSRSSAGNVLLGDGDRVLGTHTRPRTQ